MGPVKHGRTPTSLLAKVAHEVGREPNKIHFCPYLFYFVFSLLISTTKLGKVLIGPSNECWAR